MAKEFLEQDFDAKNLEDMFVAFYFIGEQMKENFYVSEMRSKWKNLEICVYVKLNKTKTMEEQIKLKIWKANETFAYRDKLETIAIIVRMQLNGEIYKIELI